MVGRCRGETGARLKGGVLGEMPGVREIDRMVFWWQVVMICGLRDDWRSRTKWPALLR